MLWEKWVNIINKFREQISCSVKASEVVKHYQQGKRDFRRANLRGQSFKDQNLSGADFSEADIRGANFKGAVLRSAKFKGIKAGLQKRWAITLVFISWLISTLGGWGFLFAFVRHLESLIVDFSSLENQITGWINLMMLIIFHIILFRKGLMPALGAVVVAFAAGVAVGIYTIAFALTVVSYVVGSVFGVLAIVLALVGAVTFTLAIALAVVRVVAGAFALALVVAGAVALTFAGVETFAEVGAFALPLAIALVGAAVNAYIGWRAIKGDPRDAWIRTVALVFASMGGTSFYNADLTDADFTGATLKSTDLRAKSLIRTCWKDTVKLDLARVGKNLLGQTEVRELLISGYGYKKSYIRANLRGANLMGVNLNEANLKFADLSEATFAEANLDGANLTEVNAVGTNFTRASMTGACLEAWNIESSTKLDQVDCQYVYLLESSKPGTDDRERRPSSGIFQPGEFTKLFEEVLDTVDLIFRNGVDWKAFVAAFKKVQVENEDTPLEIQGIENKGDGVVVVKVKVPPDTNKEKIHQEFTQNYELALKEVEKKYKAELAAKDREIEIYREKGSEMKEIARILAERPIQNIIDITNKTGNDMSDTFNIDQGNATNPNTNIAKDNAQQTINITNPTSEQKQSLAEAAAEIQKLLEQLDKNYGTDTVAGQMQTAQEAVKQIASNTSLADRVLSALRVGGSEALKQTLNHPAATFVLALLDDWQKTKS